MPGKLKVRVLAARHLPVMDRASENTDAFVELKMADETFKTDVCRQSLNPTWNSEWFRFNLDDRELQDESLQIRVMDHDTYSANDAIGKVHVDLKPLMQSSRLRKSNTNSNDIMCGSLAGWLPIFDSMHGIRGEVHVVIRLELFSDFNRFRDSSCGIRIFCSDSVPEGHRVVAILGFVEALIVNDDPEYQWIDRLRTPRASNEARQTLFVHLGGEIRRKMGLRAIDIGANAILGFQQKFDLEGDTGVVARAIGTAVHLVDDNSALAPKRQYSNYYENSGGAAGADFVPTHARSSSYELLDHFEACVSHLAPARASAAFLASSNSSMAVMGIGSMAAAIANAIAKVDDDDLITPSTSLNSSKSGFGHRRPFAASKSMSLDKIRFKGKSNKRSKYKRVKSVQQPTIVEQPSREELDFTVPNEKRRHLSDSVVFNEDKSDNNGNYSEDDKTLRPSSALSSSSLLSTSSSIEERQSLSVLCHLAKNQGSISEIDSSQEQLFEKEQQQQEVQKSLQKQERGQEQQHKVQKSEERHHYKQEGLQKQHEQYKRELQKQYGHQQRRHQNDHGHMKQNQHHKHQLQEITSRVAVKLHKEDLRQKQVSSSTSSTIAINTSHDVLSPKASLASREQINMDDADADKGNRNNNAVSHQQSVDMARSFEDNDSVLIAPSTTNQFSPVAKNLANGLSSQVNVDQLLEYPFVTLKTFPPGFIQRLGGLVSCRSVKFLDTQELDASVRSSWWQEIRQEVRSHARSIACNIVVGYQEDTVIWDDVMILSASGTAAQADLNQMLNLDSKRIFGPPFFRGPTSTATTTTPGTPTTITGVDCSIFHLPFSETSLPYNSQCHRCAMCNCGKVPDVLFSSTEPPDKSLIAGKGDLVQAKVVRVKRDLKGENDAKAVSDALPFIEYELHRQLLNKLKVKCMNALFGLRTKLTLSDHLLIGVATATGCAIRALPFPKPPRLVSSVTHTWKQNDPHFLQRAQKRLETRIAENARYLGLTDALGQGRTSSSNSNEDVDFVATGNAVGKTYEEYNEVDFSVGSKDTCVLEIDDSEDVDILDSLLDPFPPKDTDIFASQTMLGVNTNQIVQCCQLFSQVWRGRLHPSSRDLNLATQKLLELVFFKLRRLRPLVIAAVDFNIDASENDGDIQLWIYGTALSLAPPQRSTIEETVSPSSSTAAFSVNSSVASVTDTMDELILTPSPNFYSSRGPMGNMVHLTPLNTVPGHRIDAYLGNINFFLIRETTSLRESGGMNSFIHSFSAEVMAVARAHVAALGGNALVSLFMAQFVVSHSVHKNQGQCLMHVGGDVVAVSPVLKP